jgi:hypothetical protein
MQTVICDTNIWYDLAENRKNIDRLVGVELIATSVNITEIASAPYLVSDIGLIARTADAMYKNNHKVVISNPMEYLISLFHWEYEPNTIAERRLLEGLNTLMDMDLNYIPAQNIVDTERQIKEVLDSQNELASRINNGLQKIRQNIKRQEGKEKYRKIDFIDKWKKYFSELVLEYSKQHCDKEYKLDINDKAWDQLEFFLYTWEYYFKNNLEIGNWKFDKNDWCDLFNLVYVYPGSKYWTSECKWNRIFDSNERLRKYNFST